MVGAFGQPGPAAPAPAPKRKSRAGLIAAAAIVAFAVAGGATAYALLKDQDKGGTSQSQGKPAGESSSAPAPTGNGKATGTGADADAGADTDADAGSDAAAGDGATDGGAATPSAEAGRPAAPPEPVAYKGIDLTEFYELDLSDEPLKPVRDEGDIRYSSSGFVIPTGASGRLVILRSGQEGSLETCVTETRYTGSISSSLMSKGTRICLQNGSGDVALITVQAFSPESDPSEYVTLDVTVWRGAMDVEQSG
ncbi:hypothetical protein BJP39_25760 [Streptomyces sp. CC77]|nr:hypothetical protein BJP39_25760 [Streptomyces sp. CC77]